MAFSQADLDAIDSAIKSGASRVDYPSGGSVTYCSLSEMRSVRSMIADAVASANGTEKKPRRLKIYSVKDY